MASDVTALTSSDGGPRSAGLDVEFHRNPSTGHWFSEWDRPDAFEPKAARLTWDRTVGFLGGYLP